MEEGGRRGGYLLLGRSWRRIVVSEGLGGGERVGEGRGEYSDVH